MLFSSSKKIDVILILDVQSSVVRGSIARFVEGHVPEIIFTYNSQIAFKANTDSGYLIKVTLKAVEETVLAATKFISIYEKDKERLHLISIHFALYSPWIVSQAKTLTVKFQKPVTITESYVKRIIDSERDKMASDTEGDVRVIEEKIFDVSINGYVVSDWRCKVANDIQVTYTISVAGAKMIDKFVHACGLAVKDKNIYFHSGLLLQQMGISSVSLHATTYALVHVHGELTDVLVSKDRSCLFFGSFPTGVRTIVRKISLATSTDEQTAESSLTLYIGGHLDQIHGKDEALAIERVSREWVSDLSKMLDGAKDIHIPAFVISSWSHDDFFAGILKESFPKAQIEILSIDDLLPHVSYSRDAERRRLTGLYAIALFLMKKK